MTKRLPYWRGQLWGGGVNNVANGYVRVPTGTIIQWGSLTAPSGVSDFTLIFPISFPSNCRALIAVPVFNNTAADEFVTLNVSSIGQNNATCRTRYMKSSGPVTAATGITVNFIAVGY